MIFILSKTYIFINIKKRHYKLYFFSQNMYRTFAPAEAPNNNPFADSYDKQFKRDVENGEFNDLRQWPAYIKKLSDETLKKYKGKTKFKFLNKKIELELDRRQIPGLWARYIAPLYTVGIKNIKEWAKEAKKLKLSSVDQIKAFVQSKLGDAAVVATAMDGHFRYAEAEFQPGVELAAVVIAILFMNSMIIWMDVIRAKVRGISEQQINIMATALHVLLDFLTQ
jgi:hypothetical protein